MFVKSVVVGGTHAVQAVLVNYGLIETVDLWKTYVMGSEEIHALRGVSLQIERGESRHHGSLGVRQSTLMNLIGCLDTPSKSSCLLNGKQVSQMNDTSWRASATKIGFVFQTFNLLPRATALHNVELPLVYAGSGREGSPGPRKGARKSRADVAHEPPAQRLSGGQRQRVAAARSSATLDPAGRRADGNLDSKTGLEIMGVFERPPGGNTIVLVTHEPDVAAFATARFTSRRPGRHDVRHRTGRRQSLSDGPSRSHDSTKITNRLDRCGPFAA